VPRRFSKSRKVAGKQLISVADFLRLRRRRKVGWVCLCLVLALAWIVIDQSAGGVYVSDDYARYHGKTFEVVRVIDGDTLEIKARDGEDAVTRIRLWGVDTPEKENPRNGQEEEPFALEAQAYTTRLTMGQKVTLWLEPHRVRGRYDRLLAYVELPDGTLLNARLIEAGLSPGDDRWGHARLDEFARLEAEAKHSGRGIWGD